MSPLETIAAQIIKGQEFVIGPLAWSEAEKVEGLLVDMRKGDVSITGSGPKNTIDQLVTRYERLFGHASRVVCIDAVAALIKNMVPSDIPSSLIAEHE